MKMEEEDSFFPMDIDSEDDSEGYDNTANVLPKQEDMIKQEQHSLKTVTQWLLDKTKKTRVRDINPWEGFISPSDYAQTERTPHEYKHQFTLSQLRQQQCPLPITLMTCRDGKNTSNSDDRIFYPFHFIVKRWNNQSGIDLGCNLIKQPNAVSEMVNKVMENIPMAVPGTFMIMKNGTTQDSYRAKDGEAADGVALAGRNFGVINEKYLKAFGCIEKHHLTRGCLEIPEQVIGHSRLVTVFANLRLKVKIFGPKLGQKKENKSNNNNNNKEQTSMDIDGVAERFFLIPCTSLIAWTYDTMDDAERAQYNIYALQIRSRNKTTGEITKPYWIVDDPSFAWMIEHCNKGMIEKVSSVAFEEIGLNVYPFKNPETWDNSMVVEGLDPLMPKKDVDAVWSKKRGLYIKFYTGCVSFPRGLKNAKNLAPIIPSDWYDARDFKNSMKPSISQVPHNMRQRKK